jgi:hypothetical protein
MKLRLFICFMEDLDRSEDVEGKTARDEPFYMIRFQM